MRSFRLIGLLGAAAAVAISSLAVVPAGAVPRGATVSHLVDVTHDAYADNEESMGMSPGGRLLSGAWNDWDYNDGCGFSYSTDGGAHWAPRTFVPGLTEFTNDPNIPGTGSFPIAGDPAVVFNPKSHLFDVVCQAFFGAPGQAMNLLSTTFDPAKADPNADENFSYGTQVGGSLAWTTPVAVTTGTSNGTQKGGNGKFADHETIIVDTGTGPGHHFGRLSVAWAEFSGGGKSPIDVAYSDDDGHDWTGPIRVSDQGHQFDQDARPSIGPDGTVYVTWINSPNDKSLKSNVAMADMSTDGGNTWGPDAVAAPIPGAFSGLPNSKYRVFTDVWSTVDQVRGTVQIAFTDDSTGAANVYAVHNLAAGDLSQWSTPIRVKPSSNEEFFPWLSSAPNGRVDLVFYDRTCDPADTKNCVTLSSSSDGGVTWTTTALTTVGFDGDHYQACLAFVDPPDCGSFFLGDYIAVASNNRKAQVLFTGNGPEAMDVFSVRATF
ncbi:MAG TPA: sialidase family protein [Actinomycetota bacterium]